jgi:hypothetical protein
MARKRILLVNPHIEDFAAYDHFAKPLGLLWLASYLRERFDISFLNALDRENQHEKPVRIKEDGTGDFLKRNITKPEALSDIPRTYKRYGLSDSVFLDEPLFQNNTVYLYRSGFDMDYYQHLKDSELNLRREAENED